MAFVDTLHAVRSYITQGWAVVPLHDVSAGICSCGSTDEPKHSTNQGGKHPLWGGWQNAGIGDATVAAQIWTGRPQANVGIVTGRVSGLWVLDIDPEHGGDEHLAALVAANGGLPETWTVQTGSGGRHYYWRMPEFDFTTSRGQLPVGLDVRGNRGQVVAPPSYTLKGAYRVLVASALAPAPTWLLELIRPPERAMAEHAPEWEVGARISDPGMLDRGQVYARSAMNALLRELAQAVPGSRNDTAYRVARRLAELVNSAWSGLDGAEVAGAYMVAALACDIDGGFSQTEAADVLRKAIAHQGGRGVALPAADFLGSVWTPPVFPPEISGMPNIDSSNNGAVRDISPGARNGGQQSDFDQAGQGSAPNPFVSPAALTSTAVAGELTNGYLDQPQRQDSWEEAVTRELSRVLVRREAQRRALSFGQRVTDFAREAMDDAALAELAEPEPLIDGWLDLDCLARINGPSGQGKSFVALDIAASVATGRAWHGRAVTQVKALYVVGESPYVMNTRAQAWRERAELDSTGVTWLARAVTIDGPEWSAFVQYAVTVAKGGLIVLDTQARMTVGSDENDATEMGLIVAGLDQLRAETGACVLLIHHRGLSGQHGRGSTAVRGAMDTELDCSLNGVTITLKSTKQKNRPDPAPMLLTMNSLSRSVVLVGEADAQSPSSPFVSPKTSLTPRQRAALALAQALIDAAGSGLTKAEARHNARTAMGLQSTDAVKQQLTRGWADLIAAGRIAKALGRESYYFIELEGVGLLGMNPDKVVQGGPEVYVQQ